MVQGTGAGDGAHSQRQDGTQHRYVLRKPWGPAGARARIRKYTFNLASKRDTYEEELLWETPAQDIGRIDTRFMTLPNRYAFTAYNDPARPYFAGPTHTLGESCFVPRRGTRVEEGDGYLIGDEEIDFG